MLSLLVSLALGTAVAAPTRDFAAVFSEIQKKSADHAPDVQTAAANYRQKGGSLYSAWTKFVPHATFKTSRLTSKDYSFLTSGSIPLLPGFTPEQIDLDRWEVDVTMGLYNRAAHLGLMQVYTERDVAREQLNLRTTEQRWKLRQYLGNYLLAAYREAASRGALETAKTSLREAKLRFDLGQKTKIDVLREESNLTALEAKLASNQQEFLVQKAAVLDYTGLSPEELSASGITDYLVSEATLNSAIDSFTRGTDAALAKLQTYVGDNAGRRSNQVVSASDNYSTILSNERLTDIQARGLMAQEWPDVSLQASLNKQAPDWATTYSTGQISYNFGIVLSVPIFSGGSVFSSYREMSSAIEAARIKSARDSRSLFTEVENENMQIVSLGKALDSNTVRVQRDEEILRLSLKSYQLGKTTTLELLSAQNDLLNSKVDLADTKIKLAVLARQFAWNLGVNLE